MMTTHPFPEIDRVDARQKVTGQTRYSADVHLPGMLFAMIVPATIAKGRLLGLDTRAARGIPGVVRVLTSQDFPPPTPARPGVPPPPPTITTEIAYRGQPVALVVAETVEAAIESAESVRARYRAEPFEPVLGNGNADRRPGKPTTIGDAGRALARADVVVNELYETPTQHHNPIELFATTAIWARKHLTVYDCTQGATMARFALAGALRLDPGQITIKSEYIGGGFGQKGAPKVQTALVARAAMLTKRPVKLVAPRGQVFHHAPYRPRTELRVRLGADHNGRMTALQFDVTQENTPTSIFSVDNYHEGVSRLYGIDNYAGTGSDVYIDRQAPGNMRGTQTFPACFAIESAVDELAYKLGRDPLDVRLANDTRTDPLTGKRLSGRYSAQCLREGARRFGWEQRTRRVGSMQLSDGTLVGWGVACGIFHANMSASQATLRVGADGTTRLVTGGHEMGQGIRTAIANTLRQGLDLNPDNLEIVIGDTSAGPQPLTSGQWGTASVVPVTAKAVAVFNRSYEQVAAGRRPDGNIHQRLASLNRPFLEVSVTQLAPGQDPSALEVMRNGGLAIAGPTYPRGTAMSYIAHFVEVHVEPGTRRIRMPRAVSIADVGRVVSPRTARSQMYGGVVWGFGSALREQTEVDPRYAGYLNDDLADYVVPVNADIGDIDVGFVDQPDRVANSVGAKGMGEIVMTGTAAALANAVYHATGKRQRKLPILLDDLF